MSKSLADQAVSDSVKTYGLRAQAAGQILYKGIQIDADRSWRRNFCSDHYQFRPRSIAFDRIDQQANNLLIIDDVEGLRMSCTNLGEHIFREGFRLIMWDPGKGHALGIKIRCDAQGETPQLWSSACAWHTPRSRPR